MISCPYCGNMFGIISSSNGTNYCGMCNSYFKDTPLTNSIASNENSITIRIPDAANPAIYCTDDTINLRQPEENKLTINSKEISIKTIR